MKRHFNTIAKNVILVVANSNIYFNKFNDISFHIQNMCKAVIEEDVDKLDNASWCVADAVRARRNEYSYEVSVVILEALKEVKNVINEIKG